MSVMAMLETIAMKEREFYLSMHKYSIMPPKKDGRYKTFLPTQDGGRFLVARKNLRDLENIIINHYRNNDSVHSISALLEDFLEDRKNSSGLQPLTVTGPHSAASLMGRPSLIKTSGKSSTPN